MKIILTDGGLTNLKAAHSTAIRNGLKKVEIHGIRMNVEEAARCIKEATERFSLIGGTTCGPVFIEVQGEKIS